MIDFFDVAVFSMITGAVLLAATVVRLLKTAPKQDQQKILLRRRPDSITIEKKPNLQSKSASFDRWFSVLLIRAGLRIDRVTAMLLISCVALAAAATAFVFELQPLIQIAIGGVVFMGGFIVYYVIMLRRIRAFNLQFPTALELMARATRAGENLENALLLVTKSSDEPASSEFGQYVRQMQMGLSPEYAALDLAERIRSTDVHLFAHTIALNRSIGGKLADSLERLSLVIRSRTECAEKLRSVTGIGRFAVLSIVLMGIFALIYMLLAEPEYVSKLTQSDLGYKLMAYAVVSEFVGLCWVGWTLKSQY